MGGGAPSGGGQRFVQGGGSNWHGGGNWSGRRHFRGGGFALYGFSRFSLRFDAFSTANRSPLRRKTLWPVDSLD
jgi:hypothetical protein